MEAVANPITPQSDATYYQREEQRPFLNPDIEKVTRRTIDSSGTDKESQPLTKRQIACSISTSLVCLVIAVVLVVISPKDNSIASAVGNVTAAGFSLLSIA